jgi:hypothetical protein
MVDFKGETIAKLKEMSLDEVIDFTAEQQEGHWSRAAGMVEIARRQTDWQMRAAQAQIEAAGAEKEAAKAATAAAAAEADAARAGVVTAEATQLSATHMRRSVMVAVASLVFACFAALASSVQSYVAWTGRNDLLKSTLAATIVNTCGDMILLGMEATVYSGIHKIGAVGSLSPIDQINFAVKSAEFSLGYFGKAYTIISVARALDILGAEETAKEYERIAAPLLEQSRKVVAGEEGIQMGKMADGALMELAPKIERLCQGIRWEFGVKKVLAGRGG